MRQGVKHISLRTKLFLLILLCFCVPSMIVGWIWNVSSADRVERIAAENNRLLIEQINDRLDEYFRNLGKVFYPYLTHPLVTEFLRTDPDDKYGQFNLSRRIQDELFPGIIYSLDEIVNFSIVSANGMIVSSNGGFDPVQRFGDITGRIANGDSFSILDVKWSGNIPMLTVVQKLGHAAPATAEGMFIIDMNVYEVTRFFKNVKIGKSGYVWIAGGNGSIVYHPDRQKIGQTLPAEDMARLLTGASGYFMNDAEKQQKLVSYQHSEVSGWVLVSEVPFAEMIGDLNVLRSMSVAATIGLIVLALLVAGGFSLSVTNSLLYLQKLMKKVEQGNLAARAPLRKFSYEIDNLYNGFNKMVEELRRLIEVEHRSILREKEMEIRQRETSLKMMQSQIHPHFLYNTLEVINTYAIISDIQPISRMATALAALFRYSVNQGIKQVTLKEELAYIHSYLAIQSERNPDFIFDVRVEENESVHVRSASLIVQPLVENAFIHGYEKYKMSPDYIAIHGERHGDGYRLQVIDRGRGMPPELVERYNAQFHPFQDAEEADLERDSGGIGLISVHRRIRLLFGRPYGLHIVKSDESGTIMELKLPYNENGG